MKKIVLTFVVLFAGLMPTAMQGMENINPNDAAAWMETGFNAVGAFIEKSNQFLDKIDPRFRGKAEKFVTVASVIAADTVVGAGTLAKKAGDAALKVGSEIAKEKGIQRARGEAEALIAREKAAAWGAQAVNFMTNKQVLKGIATLFVAYFVTKHSAQITAFWIESKIGKPTLVLESSRKSLWNSAAAFFRKSEKRLTSKDVILAPEMKQEIIDIVKITRMAKAKGLGYSHILFLGPPGTGKTLSAKIIAQMSDMDYAVIAGSSFAQFGEKADEELKKLIDWANASKKGIVLFIDEADSAFGVRDGKNPVADRLVNSFLSRFEKTSHPRIKIILATNHPKRLDKAILSRTSITLEIGLPKEAEREKQLELNLAKKKEADPSIKVAQEVFDYLPEAAQQTEGFSGRSLEDLVLRLYERANLLGKSTIDLELFTSVLSKAIATEQVKAHLVSEQETFQ